MLHEARDRKKFVSDVQYLRDMQHKVDSEYQVTAGARTLTPSPVTYGRQSTVSMCHEQPWLFPRSQTHHLLAG